MGLVSNVVSIREWVEVQGGFELYAGQELVGYAITTEYGTICFSGPLGRGTSESIEAAKATVEEMFDCESPFYQLVATAREVLRND